VINRARVRFFLLFVSSRGTIGAREMGVSRGGVLMGFVINRARVRFFVVVFCFDLVFLLFVSNRGTIGLREMGVSRGGVLMGSMINRARVCFLVGLFSFFFSSISWLICIARSSLLSRSFIKFLMRSSIGVIFIEREIIFQKNIFLNYFFEKIFFENVHVFIFFRSSLAYLCHEKLFILLQVKKLYNAFVQWCHVY
jgi:hypothetical protein